MSRYLAEAGAAVALRFIDQLEAAYRRAGEHPEAGSPRYAVELDMPGLRSLMLAGFPYIVFYMQSEERPEAWRVLHAHADLPSHLQ